MSDPLQQSIIETLAYFDVFHYPLTREELFRYLWRPPAISYEQFVDALRQCIDRKIIQAEQGFFFLPSRTEMAADRQRWAVPTELKLKKAVRAARLIRSVPFLKAIFVCNSVAAGLAKSESDIDFFIITEKKRAWLVRFFSNLVLYFLRLRRHGAVVRDRICLSFYSDLDNLDLKPLALGGDDVYLAYWLVQLMPLYDPENIYARLLDANPWVKSWLPHAARGSASFLPSIAPTRLGKSWQKLWKKFWAGRYGDLMENQARELQLTKMKMARYGRPPTPDSGIVTTAGVIKLHEKDRRAEYRDQWLNRIRLL